MKTEKTKRSVDDISEEEVDKIFNNPNLKFLPARGIYATPPPTFSLVSLRKSLGLTQAEIAERASMTQSEVSRLEKCEDFRLSTLERYARALGGNLRISVRLNSGSYELDDSEWHSK